MNTYPTACRSIPRKDLHAATSPRPPRRPRPTRGPSSRAPSSCRSRARGSTARRRSPTRRTARAASPAAWPAGNGSAGSEPPPSRVNRRSCKCWFKVLRKWPQRDFGAHPSTLPAPSDCSCGVGTSIPFDLVVPPSFSQHDAGLSTQEKNSSLNHLSNSSKRISRFKDGLVIGSLAFKDSNFSSHIFWSSAFGMHFRAASWFDLSS